MDTLSHLRMSATPVAQALLVLLLVLISGARTYASCQHCCSFCY
jgi:hypothetical protein